MIMTQAEIRLALGLTASITDVQRALIEMILPRVDNAIADVLHYDPQQASRTEFYPKQAGASGDVESVWDSNGTSAYMRTLGGNAVLQLTHLPVRSVTNVWVDYDGRFGQRAGSFVAANLWTLGEDYWLDLESASLCMTGHLLTSRAWPNEPGTIKVEYTAGYSKDELNGRAVAGSPNASLIKHAALATAIKVFTTLVMRQKHSLIGFTPGLLSSESLGKYSYSLDGSSIQALAAMKVMVPSEALDSLEKFINMGVLVL